MAGLGKDEPAGLLSYSEAIVGYLTEVPQHVVHAYSLVGFSDDCIIVENSGNEKL